ncbi:polysaccharide pyruvyl transferase family protein [Parasporobacterium paucivorans]|uniref:Polysaccharide pyruvyl transferase n=1 Tax=Parasporobacterium paucivorans DSM 15970 TaxID=1122934 RepID=A0A1M6GUW4_9FIRM|nr:polysaccharide pyruvyl transferase family protein [Parasporobacterium paucivorans]SHJ13721.1 Polysaccharide pyruvyl transferase [Parasporobacterium paucivorans DSM 15970]
MKNIGIITFHRALNYGSALQAYALNKYLNNQGYRAETIDFQTKAQKNLYSLMECSHSVMGKARNLHTMLFLPAVLVRRRRFDRFIEENVKHSKKRYHTSSELYRIGKKFDYYICGSDQIWNPYCTDFDEAYMLPFVEDKSRCISYAPSIGTSQIEEKYHFLFRDNLKGFKAQSTREEAGAHILEEITGTRPAVLPDPVFLLSRREWKKIIPARKIKKPYIFCYFIGNVAGMRSFAINMRKKTGMPLVVINKNLRDLLYWNKKMYDAGPKEFLSLLYYADFICTDSFHAAAFSAIFNKQFWIFVDKDKAFSSKSRIYNIANKLGLENRVLTECSRNIRVDEPIDFKLCNERIELEREKGKKYLADALGD